MRRWDLMHYVFTISVAAALLAGCGGTQPPIGAPGGMPESKTVAQGRAIVHRIRTASSSYQVLYNFAGKPDGGDPEANLINITGTLYSTTSSGGTHRKGTVFSITTKGTEHVLYSFGQHHRGADPWTGLIDSGGTLYGTTFGGGAYRRGTVFSLSATGKEHILHSFGGSSADGTEPKASLIDVHGTLYGTTLQGGAISCPYNTRSCGTVFSVTTAGAEKVLHSFGYGDDGRLPLSSLIEVKGTFYGTTARGGSYSCGNGGCGTVFSITPGGTEKVIYSFGLKPDGNSPLAGLIDVNGTLYGTTSVGGTYGWGTVFSITTGGTEKVLHSFGYGGDGRFPGAPLIDAGGTLYGTTEEGGNTQSNGFSGYGTIFSVTTGGSENVVHNFGSGGAGSIYDGAVPTAGLIDVNGTLYGTTVRGGAYHICGQFFPAGCGTVFALTP